MSDASLTQRVGRGVKRLALSAACAAGVGAAGRRANRDRLLVVCYHGVRDDAAPDRHWLLLARSEFARQIRYLAEHYRCVSLDEGFAELAAGALRGPTACVTFDDGYLNNRALALPILEQARVPAVIYLPTGLIERGELPWTTRLELAFVGATVDAVDLSSLGLGVRALTEPEARSLAGRAALERLKFLPDEQRATRVAELARALGDPPAARSDTWRLMDWDDVRAAGRGGLVTFGAHTVEHRILSQLVDDEVEREVVDSVRTVAGATDAVSNTFAYPNGRRIDFDERAQAAARRAGCVAAVSTIDGLNGPEDDPYALRRLSVGQHMSLEEFHLRAAGVAPFA